MNRIDIPVGVSDFAEIRKNRLYFVDKSGLIAELLKTTGIKVTLIMQKILRTITTKYFAMEFPSSKNVAW